MTKEMAELQINTRQRLEIFFQQLSSEEQLISYKRAAPFVHIPNELIAQWDGFMYPKKRNWFKDTWTQNEWKELNSFDTFFNEQLALLPKKEKHLDIPKILETKTWKEIMTRAQGLKFKIFRDV